MSCSLVQTVAIDFNNFATEKENNFVIGHVQMQPCRFRALLSNVVPIERDPVASVSVAVFGLALSLPSEPSTVDLEKVSNVIVDQSLKDQVFSKEAGRICYTIVQVW